MGTERKKSDRAYARIRDELLAVRAILNPFSPSRAQQSATVPPPCPACGARGTFPC